VLSNYCLDSDSLTYNARKADCVSRSFGSTQGTGTLVGM